MFRRIKQTGRPTPGRADAPYLARAVAFRVTAASLPGERIIRNQPDQTPGMVQRPSISVPSALSSPA